MTDPERLANIAQHKARTAYQAWLDAQLLPASDEPADQVNAAWEPIAQYLKEGPDVGFREEAESEDCRVN